MRVTNRYVVESFNKPLQHQNTSLTTNMELATLNIHESELLATIKPRGAIIDLLGSASDRLQQAFDRFSDARFNSTITVTFKSSAAETSRGRIALGFLPRGDPSHIERVLEGDNAGVSYDTVVRMPGAVSARITSGSTSVSFDPRMRQPTRTQIDDINTMFVLVASTEPSSSDEIIGELWITYDVTFYDMLPPMLMAHHATFSFDADPNEVVISPHQRPLSSKLDIHHPDSEYVIEDSPLSHTNNGTATWDEKTKTNECHKCFKVKWDSDTVPKAMQLISENIEEIKEVLPNKPWPGSKPINQSPAPEFHREGNANVYRTTDKRTIIQPTTKKGELTFWQRLGNGIKSVAGKVAGAISSTVSFLVPHVGKVAKAFLGFRHLELNQSDMLAIREAMKTRNYDGPNERGLKPAKARSNGPKQSQRSKKR